MSGRGSKAVVGVGLEFPAGTVFLSAGLMNSSNFVSTSVKWESWNSYLVRIR